MSSSSDWRSGRDIEAVVRTEVIAKNAIVNLSGQAAPMLAALISIPALIHHLGNARFGVLSLIWIVIGYFSLFDFGIGRAVTQAVSESIGANRMSDVPRVFWTGLVLLTGLGAIGSICVVVGAVWFVRHVLRVPLDLQPETIVAFRILALSIPIVIASTACVGFLASFQRFAAVNAVRIPLAISLFVGPLGVQFIRPDLGWITAVLLLSRAAALVAYYSLCTRVVPTLRSGYEFDSATARRLFHFGTWLTISNVISPVMTYLDRVVIGSIASVAAITYYTSPYEVVTRIAIVSASIAAVLFPAFATEFVNRRERAARLFVRAAKALTIVLIPITIPFVFLARDGLHVWLGEDFAIHSTAVLQWLAVGVLFNGMAQLPFAFVQAVNRPDVTAKLHLTELPIYVALLFWGLHRYGVVGAAAAWTLRVAIDMVLLFAVSFRLSGGMFSKLIPCAMLFVTCLMSCGAVRIIGSLSGRMACTVGVVVATVSLGWWWLFSNDDRNAIRSLVSNLARRR